MMDEKKPAGLTLRDLFALAYLSGIAGRGPDMSTIGNQCWAYADAVLAERDTSDDENREKHRQERQETHEIFMKFMP